MPIPVFKFRAVILVIAFAALARTVAAQIPERFNQADSEKGPYERSNIAIAVALLNIGCGFEGEGVCIDRGTQLARLIAVQLASYPLSAPAGGFSFTFDQSARLWSRNSQSFGPSFLERPTTNGYRKISVGLTTQHSEFERLDGVRLDNILTAHDFRRLSVPLNGRTEDVHSINTATLSLDATTSLTYASYGITDRLDIALAVPIKRISFSGQNVGDFENCGTPTGGIAPCRVRSFESPLSRTARGVGDVGVRIKYNFVKRTALALGALAEFGFPTGNEEEFLGTGRMSTKIAALTSTTWGPFSPTLNVGYSQGSLALRSFQSNFIDGFTEQNREVSYAGGFDLALGSRLTIAVDVLGRRFLDLGRLQRVEQITRSTTFDFDPSPVEQLVTATIVRQADIIQGKNLTTLIGDAGIKFNIASRYLLKANVLFPLSDNGLQSKWTPVLGIDYTFARPKSAPSGR